MIKRATGNSKAKVQVEGKAEWSQVIVHSGREITFRSNRGLKYFQPH
jgi:hypothetical protein